MTTLTVGQTVTVLVATRDEAWTAAHANGHAEDLAVVPGCTATGTYRFCGRYWVNYRLPEGTPLPKDWDRGVENMLAAPASWVTPQAPTAP